MQESNQPYTLAIYTGTIPRLVMERWNQFLDRHALSSFFQSPAFIEIHKGCRRYEPMLLLAKQKQGEVDGILLAMVIRDRIHGIPFQRILIIGGPLVTPNTPGNTAILNILLEGLRSHIPNGTVFAEIRNQQPWSEAERQIFMQNGFNWHDHLNNMIPLDSALLSPANLPPTRQRQVKSGLSQGATVRPAESLDEVNQLYQLLTDLYKNRVKKPLPPLRCFHNFYQKLHQSQRGVILVVVYKERVIGGMVAPFSGSHTLHEWYVTGVNGHKQLYPGVLATWAGIDFATQNNFQYFDFIGMGSPHQPYGVRDFKSRFGGETHNAGRWQYIHNKPLYTLAQFGYRFIKKISG